MKKKEKINNKKNKINKKMKVIILKSKFKKKRIPKKCNIITKKQF